MIITFCSLSLCYLWYFLFYHPLLFLSFNSLTLFCPSQYNSGRRTWRSVFRLQWGWTESLGSDSGCWRHDLVLASSVQLSFAREFSSLCRESFFTDAVWRKGISKVCLLSFLSELFFFFSVLCIFLLGMVVFEQWSFQCTCFVYVLSFFLVITHMFVKHSSVASGGLIRFQWSVFNSFFNRHAKPLLFKKYKMPRACVTGVSLGGEFQRSAWINFSQEKPWE